MARIRRNMISPDIPCYNITSTFDIFRQACFFVMPVGAGLGGRSFNKAMLSRPQASKTIKIEPDMTDTAERVGNGRAEALVASYERAGYARCEPAILQPAEPFLDLSGEDIRRRMYLTTDAAGRDLCLRPDFTIAVSRDYLASPDAGRPAGFCYLGPIFRQEKEGAGEVIQAGIESFGRRDIAAADAEILSLGLEAVDHYGVKEPDIRIGDAGLFIALIEALPIAPAWKRRLVKDFNRANRLAQDLDMLMRDASRTGSEYSGVLAALANSDPGAAHALVTDLLSIAGITAVGGRTVGEIADRFLEQASLGGGGLPADIRSLIERFLAIAGDPDNALAELRALAADARLALDPALDTFESRTGFLAARGVNVAGVRFSTAFSTSLDYYTGCEFHLNASASENGQPLVVGGRYDNLLTRLGSAAAIPAVGFGIFIERLAAIGGRP
jgi:ATP phosphoribosyltransferase regulatory subunit